MDSYPRSAFLSYDAIQHRRSPSRVWLPRLDDPGLVRPPAYVFRSPPPNEEGQRTSGAKWRAAREHDVGRGTGRLDQDAERALTIEPRLARKHMSAEKSRSPRHGLDDPRSIEARTRQAVGAPDGDGPRACSRPTTGLVDCETADAADCTSVCSWRGGA
ncbi:MAG: hypothetical protein M1815_005741 [Lichina confinis]|nr:MAG: hypothetical protein M1815_005741 [Lichina confinis]